MSLLSSRVFELKTPDGSFEYVISIDDDDAGGWLVKSVVVHRWDHPGSLLIVADTPQLPHWKNSPKPPKSKDHRVIKPAFIGRVIHKAIKLGWDTAAKGGPYHLSLREHPVT